MKYYDKYVDNKKGANLMFKKALVLVVIVVVLIGLYICAGKGRQVGKKEKAPVSVELGAVSTQGWGTYVSKYGFSVRHPMEWRVEELSDVKPSEMAYKGYKNFALTKNVSGEPYASMEFLFMNDILSSSWRDRFEKYFAVDSFDNLLLLLEKINQYKISERGKADKIVEIISPDNLMICLIYYDKKDPWQAYFYLPKWDTLAYVSIDADSSVKEIVPILKSIRYVSNN